MKKAFLLVVLVPLFSFGQSKLSYKVFYDRNLEKNGMKVQLTYNSGVNTTSTAFHYVNNNWGEDNLFNCLIIPEKENPNISFTKNQRNNQININHPQQEKVTLAYRIKQDYVEPNYYIFHRPNIRNKSFYIYGWSLFLIPEAFNKAPLDTEVEIEVEWVGFPKDFRIHNTYASQSAKQTIKTPLWKGLFQSLFVGGDYRISKFECHGKPVYFAVEGNWYNGFTDEFLRSNFEKAVTSQRDFWEDYGQDYFTLIMTPTVSQGDSLYRGTSNSGTALRNAFVVHGTNNPFNNKESFIYLLHHELMHEWIGHKISYKHDDNLGKWFKEGFTEYYAYKNMLRVQTLTLEEYVNTFNKKIIEAYWKNPKKNIPNYKIGDDYWSDNNVNKVAYKRGAIFAFWLDNQILLKSNYTKSLDNLMRDLLEYCVKNNAQYTDELFVEFVNNYLNRDITYFLQKHLICGEDINLVKERWIEGFKFEQTDQNIPKLIFTQENESKYLLK